jgi:hypothetical protein
MVKEDDALPRNKRWTESDARVVLAKWRASGLTRVAFAESQRLKYERLRRWEKRLGDGGEKTTLRLVPMVTREAPLLTAGATTKLQLRGGAVLELDTACVDPRWVAALVVDVARGA